VRTDTSADGDDRPAPTEDQRQAELVQQVKDLWRQITDLRHTNGSPSIRKLARIMDRPRATISDWFSKQTVVPEWPDFELLITKLGDDQPERWRPRWQQARSAQVELLSLKAARPRNGTPPTAPTPSPPTNPPTPPTTNGGAPAQARAASGDQLAPTSPRQETKTESPPQPPDLSGPHSSLSWRSRRAVAVGVSAGAVIALAAALALLPIRWPWSDTTVPPLRGQSPDQACAALQAQELDCAPEDNEITREINIVHEQDPPPGAEVPKGTAVRYTYQTTPPVLLQRWEAPAPNSANFISSTNDGPPGWNAKPPIGWVYPLEETRIPGLVTIYQYRCTSGCSESPVYFLTREAGHKKGFIFEREAFRCFSPDAPPPPDTRPLQRLINNKTQARYWAVPGTSEYHEATTRDFTKPGPDPRPLCYIW
jgi:hypothetical protein